MQTAGPCRGINRATSQASAFVAVFCAMGTVSGSIVGGLLNPHEFVDQAGTMFGLHFLAGIVLWCPAVAINWLFLRIFRPMSWRRQGWRAWAAGILALAAVWLTFSLAGRGMDSYLMALGFGVMISNGAIAFAWALPPWSKRKPREFRIPGQ